MFVKEISVIPVNIRRGTATRNSFAKKKRFYLKERDTKRRAET